MTLSPINLLWNCGSTMNSVIRRCDNRMFFAQQGSMSQAYFTRQAAIKENLGQVNSFRSIAPPPPFTDCANEKSPSHASKSPLFSRPSDIKKSLGSPIMHDCTLSIEEPPTFSRPNRGLNYHNQSGKM